MKWKGHTRLETPGKGREAWTGAVGGLMGLKQMVNKKKWMKMSPGDESECCTSEKRYLLLFFFKNAKNYAVKSYL